MNEHEDTAKRLSGIREEGRVSAEDIRWVNGLGMPLSSLAGAIDAEEYCKAVENFVAGKDEASGLFGFDCEIYPRRLYVSVGVPHVRLKEVFEITADELSDDCYADVVQVNHIKEDCCGYLVRFHDVSGMTTRNIAHEASHVAMNIFYDTDCRIDHENQEPFAYLADWVCGKLAEVCTKLKGE